MKRWKDWALLAFIVVASCADAALIMSGWDGLL